MHPAAYEWIAVHATDEPVNVLDIGGRNINGTVRGLFPNATEYVSIDLYPGDGVNVVGDITTWKDDRVFDIVVCAEVLEHAENWRDIIDAAFERLEPGGWFLMTCAGPGRHPHSAVDGEWTLKAGEYYENISPADLDEVLASQDWASFLVDQQGEDVRCFAVR
jgi:hypothetical protein